MSSVNVKQTPFVAVLIAAVVLLAGTSYYYFSKYRALEANPQLEAQAATNALVAQVGKLIVLPTGETPTIATVSDPAKLKDQPFFANAQVGDKVLIYPNARKAILYSVSQNIILEVAPLTIGANPPTTAAVAPTTAPTSAATTTTKKK